jgi:hypothetical protein
MYAVLLVALISLLLRLAAVHFSCLRSSTWRSSAAAMNLSLIVFSVVFSFLILELGFFAFGVQSDSYGFTLAAQAWKQRHWRPINRFGFRDRDIPDNILKTKKLFMVVGDSLAAGAGIEDINDRFTDRLRGYFGTDWELVVVADSGWDTADEMNAVSQFPYKPECVLLSHFINDIEHAAPLTRPRVGAFSSVLVDNSYVINFAYWRIMRLKDFNKDSVYWRSLEAAYADPLVLSKHEQVLADFLQRLPSPGRCLAVVIWPHILALEKSTPMTGPIAAFLSSKGVPYLDLAEYLKGRDPRELVVNRVDYHPSARLHREVGSLIVARLFRLSEEGHFAGFKPPPSS